MGIFFNYRNYRKIFISLQPTVQSYLFNFFNHVAGDHSKCISPKCKIKEKLKTKETWQTSEFEKEMMELKKLMENKLSRLPLEKCAKGRTTSPLEGCNNVINRYACKRVDFKYTHECRVYSALCDWNEDHNIPEYQGWRSKFCYQYGLL